LGNIKIGVGHSINIKSALNDALKGVNEPDLVITFFSSIFDPQEIYRTIRNEVGKNTHIVGNSSAGEISSKLGDCQTNSITVMALESPYLNIGIGVGEGLSKNPELAASQSVKSAYKSLDNNMRLTIINKLANTFLKKSSFDLLKIKLFLNMLLIDGLAGKEEDYLRCLVKLIGKETPVVGASSGDNLRLEKTYQIANGVYTDAAVLIAMNSFLKMGTATGAPYYPTYKGALVTRSEGRVVYELNGGPAAEVLKELLNVDELTPDVFARYTTGLKSTDIYNEYVLKSPMKVLDDGSILFYAEIPKGTFLTIMETNEEYIFDSFKKTLKDAWKDAGRPKKIGAIILFNCVLRYLLKCNYHLDDINIINETFGEEVNVIGFNTYGEQGRTLGGSLGHYNQTSTLLLIGDELINE